MVEQVREPADGLLRVVRDPEVLDRDRNLKTERDRSALDCPGERSADVVLLGNRDVVALAL
jgi:hypothetical protein